MNVFEHGSQGRDQLEQLLSDLNALRPAKRGDEEDRRRWKGEVRALADAFKDTPPGGDVIAYLLMALEIESGKPGVKDAKKELMRILEQRETAAYPEEALFDERELAKLPPHSWYFRAPLELERPIFTRGTVLLDLHDNPFLRERATRQPCFAASSWKGCLNEAARQIKAEQTSIDGLFGCLGDHDPESDSEGRRGRLQFFSSGVSKTSAYTINPQDREHQAGTKPIRFTVAPETSLLNLQLIYCTYFDSFQDPEKTRI